MKVGYLHIGVPQSHESGVRRYGRFLAAEAHGRPELTVIEVEVTLTENLKHNHKLLANAAQQLSDADIIHIQYNNRTWGHRWSQVVNLWNFIRHCSRPLTVTLHDVFVDYALAAKLICLYRRPKVSQVDTEIASNLNYSSPETLSFRSVIRQGRKHLPETLAFLLLFSRVKLMFVCTEQEAQRLDNLIYDSKLKIVPHFVENRAIQITPAEARKALGLESCKTVAVQGFIYSRKGHRLLIEALPQLPEDVQVIFAGGPSPNSEKLVEELITHAEAQGLGHRLRVTGYLSEADLERYLIATDLAICPFATTSASGSLATWISIARPILASNLPQVEEYNRLEPGAIKTFEPYTSEALAQAIKHCLSSCQEGEAPAVARLRQKLSISVIFDKHLKCYEDALNGSASVPMQMQSMSQ
ncbi:glycosyltransferase [Leptolyngbya sp. FACHB-261]|uniref:glycosyltransferase n=1 Tax=Leptolyngbya sp. FACHB-261 TaxID=2692806 RepID=UPI0016882A76|nr:glycosyltransferase [Leptolyngbya sp. FACHB-261]MBD2101130.1 glycosyltransferase [Leptolyngbya sp. FACHB-261]